MMLQRKGCIQSIWDVFKANVIILYKVLCMHKRTLNSHRRNPGFISNQLINVLHTDGNSCSADNVTFENIF